MRHLLVAVAAAERGTHRSFLLLNRHIVSNNAFTKMSSTTTTTTTTTEDISFMRHPYLGEGDAAFDLPDLSAREPLGQFRAWFEAARATPGVTEANAVCLATADARGRPSARMVLLKEFGPAGFVFYTNRSSRKGAEMAANPHAALTFYWEPCKRSVRVEGRVELVSEEQSTKYFDSRPLGSKIGAAVSEQSKIIKDRGVLTGREAELKLKYPNEEEGKKLKKPDCWGGYRVVPESVEFWQGRSTRMHDRLRFRRKSDVVAAAAAADPDPEQLFVEGEDGWVIERLSP